jgi:hypothetical protein
MTPNPHAGGHLVGCPRLLIQYIHTTLHNGGCSSIHNLRTCLAALTGTHLSWMPYLRNKVIQYSFVLTENNGTRKNISEV